MYNILLFDDLSLHISYHHRMNVMYLNISNNYKRLFKNRKYAPAKNISPHYTLLTDTDLGAIYSSKELFLTFWHNDQCIFSLQNENDREKFQTRPI